MKIPSEIVLATENIHKAREMADILHKYLPDYIGILSLADIETPVTFPEETGETFCANAVLKAETVSRTLGTFALADDSGLCVTSLDGAPGLRSRRWSGVEDTDAARIELLLSSMDTAAAGGNTDRSAYFECCIAFSGPGIETESAIGRCFGTILQERRGLSGFGYDPLFLLDGSDKTLAELSGSEKNRISHRANSIQNLIFKLGWSSK